MSEQPAPIERPVTQPTAQRGIVWTPRLVIWIILLVIVAIFVLANFESVSLDYVVGNQDGPLAVWLLVSLALGYVLGWMRPHFRSRTRR
jgi:uncharacterized integral membrane protein